VPRKAASTIPNNDTCTSHSCWRQSCLQNLNTTLLVVYKKVIVCVLRLQTRKKATQSENKSGRSIVLLLFLLLLLYLLFLARTNNFLGASYNWLLRHYSRLTETRNSEPSTGLYSQRTPLNSNTVPFSRLCKHLSQVIFLFRFCDQILVCISYVSCVLSHSPVLFSFIW